MCENEQQDILDTTDKMDVVSWTLHSMHTHGATGGGYSCSELSIGELSNLCMQQKMQLQAYEERLVCLEKDISDLKASFSNIAQQEEKPKYETEQQELYQMSLDDNNSIECPGCETICQRGELICERCGALLEDEG